MGATVTTGKLAAAFARNDGQIVYVLFEKTYEKNCYPHTPRWSCLAIGPAEDVMQRVFLAASICEGGMLQARNGQIKAENYIAAWRRELANPVEMPDIAIDLKIGTSLYAKIPKEKENDVRNVLANIERNDLFTKIQEGSASVSLHKDADVILALYGNDSPISPWRILSWGDALTLREPRFGITRVKANVVAPHAQILRLTNEDLLVKIGDQPWHMGGWAYSVVGSYIIDVVSGLEMQSTGCAAGLIQSFRELCASALVVSDATRITVNRNTANVEAWQASTVDSLAIALGIVEEGHPCPEQFTCTVGEVKDKDAMYYLTCLKQDQASWEVPVSDTAKAHSEVFGDVVKSDLQTASQIDLILA
jgi:hypothetical protein